MGIALIESGGYTAGIGGWRGAPGNPLPRRLRHAGKPGGLLGNYDLRGLLCLLSHADEISVTMAADVAQGYGAFLRLKTYAV